MEIRPHAPKRTTQLIQYLRQLIESGQLSGGAKMPATRQLAIEFGVSQPLVHQVMKRLQQEDLIECQRGKRSIVKPGARRNLGHQATQIVIFVNHFLSLVDLDNWKTRIIHAAEARLGQAGYCIIRIPLENANDLVCVNEQLDRYGDDIAGVLLFNDLVGDEMLAAFEARKLPWIIVNRPHEKAVHNFVEADNLAGGQALGRALIRQGVTQLLVISLSPQLASTTVAKVTGVFQGFLMETAYPMPHVERIVNSNDNDEPSGFEAMEQYLKDHSPPQVVFAGGDLVALGVIRACKKTGLNIPDDVMVVGTTGLQVAQYSEPSLTVLEQPMVSMGQQAAGLLLEMVSEHKMKVDGVFVPSELVVRDSCPLSLPHPSASKPLA